MLEYFSRLFAELKDEAGQTMAEYAVVLAVITIAVVVTLGLLSTRHQRQADQRHRRPLSSCALFLSKRAPRSRARGPLASIARKGDPPEKR